ncbi:MAG: hypothetical protein U0795_00415 [Pirellulales bacterium]
MRTLQTEYRDTLRQDVEYLEAVFRNGIPSGGMGGPSGSGLEDLFFAKKRLAEAELKLAQSPAERIKQLETALELARQFEETMNQSTAVGRSPGSAAIRARAFRLRTEIRLERERMSQLAQ